MPYEDIHVVIRRSEDGDTLPDHKMYCNGYYIGRMTGRQAIDPDMSLERFKSEPVYYPTDMKHALPFDLACEIQHEIKSAKDQNNDPFTVGEAEEYIENKIKEYIKDHEQFFYMLGIDL